jgi:hypothetical protein
LTPGGTKLFTAKLTGTEDDVSVTWALDPSDRKAGTTINENGNLSIDQSEAVDTVLVVRATGNDGKYGTAQVTMKAAPAVVSGVTIKVGGSSPSAITLERGETETFTAEVTGDNLGDAGQKVSWDIVETGKSDSTTISNGVLSIAADEGLSGLAVKATSTTDTSKSATVTVNIPTVSISLSPTSVGVQKGSTQTFTATVTALHGADSGVTWSIVGSHTASSLSSTGDSRTLTVGGNESLDSLTVRVTSTFTKPQVHADAAVTLSDAPPSVSGVTITTPSDNPLYIKRGTANTQFSASVQGSNSPSQTVTWSVSGNSQGGGTSIGTNDGKLSIGQAETAESLTVRATAAGTSIYGEKTVLIPTVKSVSITTAPSKVARGDAAGSTVAASVTVANNETSLLSTDVKWIVTNAKKPETKIAGGKLYVDKDETATPLTIEATASANSSKYATASVPVSSVTGVTVSPVVTVSRGSNATLSAEVAGVNNPSRTVTWAITSVGHASGTSIDSSGKLTVASDEAKSSITVKATSAEDNRVSGTVTVQIPTVTNVTITPSTAEVAKGGSTTFSATVAASGGAVETVTWSVVTTGVNENTKFPNPTSSGLFQVASDETVASITIRATSTADGSKSGTATVSVPQPTVISVELSPGRVKVIAGKTQQFGATVTGTNSPPQTVIWSIEGNNLDGISISEGGNLFVAHFGTAETFTVRATSTFDTSKSGEVAVTVLVPTVSGVELIPSGNVFVPPNVTQQFSATVTGTNDPDQTVNWSIEGPHHTGTHINDSGYLIVDIDETAASFKVRATHTFDLSKYGEATVNTRPIAVDH